MNKSFLAVPIIIAVVAIGTSAFAQAPAPAVPEKPASLTGTWSVDPVHTSVTFTIPHFGISSVPGRFDEASGTIIAVTDHPEKSSVQFTIQTASLNTNNTYRDNDVKSKNYLDVATYPTITFQSTSVSKAGHGTFVAVGNLTMHGVTKQISLPFTLMGPILDPFGSSRIGVETHIVLSRLDYGVGGNDQLADGSFAIGKDVDVTIDLEATPAKAS
jgi:polyisoprenoid-binding protein YceI